MAGGASSMFPVLQGRKGLGRMMLAKHTQKKPSVIAAQQRELGFPIRKHCLHALLCICTGHAQSLLSCPLAHDAR